VLDDGAIEIIVDTDPEATEPHVYTIERLDPGDTIFEPIAAQTATNGLTLNFVDSAVHSDEASYIYRVEVSNECGDIVGTSQEAQNILLVGLIDSQLLENTLFWTAYDEFPSAGPTPGGYSTGVAGYRVYRSLQSTGSLELIASLSAGSSHFEDDVSQMLYTPGEFCYLIEAIDLESGPMGSANYALSNSFCLTQEPVIWVPNAIMAHGENNIFMPVVSFADIDSYVLEVFSRWGDVMFHSDALGHGWDGMYRGTLAPEGSYGYTLSIQDGAGKIFNRSGMLHLLVGGE
jgi:gliding motility-associated-like protein